MRFIKRIFQALILVCIFAHPASADKLTAACAANFTPAMKELALLYESQTGTETNVTFGSTGMLYGQLTHGAPYDIFFAADERRPALLHEAGLAEPPRLYARGRVVLWTPLPEAASATTWKDVLELPEIRKIGIASPKTAPYGLRAVEALETAGLFKSVEPELVYGKSVGMAFQYAFSGAAQASFVALSQALSDKGVGGTYRDVAEAGPVGQAACVLNTPGAAEAHRFLDWLATPPAAEIIRRYGYELP